MFGGGCLQLSAGAGRGSRGAGNVMGLARGACMQAAGGGWGVRLRLRLWHNEVHVRCFSRAVIDGRGSSVRWLGGWKPRTALE